jgi:hypothetical protein
VDPPHAVPLSVNAAGLVLAPVKEPLNPIEVLPPAASEPFQLSLVTVTCSPLCVQMPSQPLLTCWLPGKLKPSVQLVIAAAPLVIVMLPVNPPGQLLVTEYATAHPVAAFAALASVTAPAVPAATTAAPRIAKIVRTFRIVYDRMIGQ